MTNNQRFETRKSSAHGRALTLARRQVRSVKYATGDAL